MTQKQIRLKRIDNLNQRLTFRYENTIINGDICFLLGNGNVCRIDSMGDEYDALVIEYADNLDMARKNVFGEDGDLFCMAELGEDEMFDAMVKEIDCFL